ncbi:putative leader peptide [Rhodococcus sp. NPDC003382]|uniref:putative leader peptide n=1 Tax=unclassified Rhodococcus (in: high G+C Gram-positive bacteria) TaxID=192944 RepID=UPI0034D76401
MPCSEKSAVAVSRSLSAGPGLPVRVFRPVFDSVWVETVTPSSLTDPRNRQIGLSTCTVSFVTHRQLTRRLHVDLVRVAGAACCHIHR